MDKWGNNGRFTHRRPLLPVATGRCTGDNGRFIPGTPQLRPPNHPHSTAHPGRQNMAMATLAQQR